MDIRKFLSAGRGRQHKRIDSDDDDFEKPCKKARAISSDSELDDADPPCKVSPPVKIKSNKESPPSKRGKIKRISDELLFDSEKSMKKLSVKEVEGPRRELWVNKYKPETVNKILGQQGAKSPLSKLIEWLKNWHNPGGHCEGHQYKAVLLSGPPGVGKTTTAHLVCQHLGYAPLDFNASDTRSKSALQGGLTCASSSSAIVKGESHVRQACIIMDEVDGMAGNEDRGGIQELISIIKTSKVPMICICNDRQHPKVRSLANHCFDLRFQKLRTEQIKSCIMSILCREKLKLEPRIIDEVVLGANGDLRQAIHTANMLTGTKDSDIRENCSSAKENISLSLFETCRRVFLPALEGKPLSIMDRNDLFFTDYNIMPLFVQENYAHVVTDKGKNVLSPHLATVANYIAAADVLTNSMRSLNNWSLLRSVSMYSTALPCHLIQGHMSGMINFPGWLGRQSKRNRIQRQLDEAYSHYRLKSFITRDEFRLHIAVPLLTMIYRPILSRGVDGVKEACARAQTALFQKTDIDYVAEACFDYQPPCDSKLKANFTKSMNQTHVLYPYRLRERKAAAAAKAVLLDFDPAVDETDDQSDDDSSSSDLKTDRSIKKREIKTKAAKKTNKSTGRKRGRGK